MPKIACLPNIIISKKRIILSNALYIVKESWSVIMLIQVVPALLWLVTISYYATEADNA